MRKTARESPAFLSRRFTGEKYYNITLQPLHTSHRADYYNNGRILSAAVIVTSPGLGSTATEVISSPSVTTTYRCHPNLLTICSGRVGR